VDKGNGESHEGRLDEMPTIRMPNGNWPINWNNCLWKKKFVPRRAAIYVSLAKQ
jgi:hypothetical protein